jgi:hypothetical protein
MIKTCATCSLCKSSSEFNKYSAMKDGLHWECRSCVGLRRKSYYEKNRQREIDRSVAWKISNKEKAKDASLKRKFGITIQDYNAMIRSQNGKCAICDKDHSVSCLVVDHDHNSGRVRKLLCHQCNLALGNLKENVLFAERMLDYIKKNCS